VRLLNAINIEIAGDRSTGWKMPRCRHSSSC